MSTFNFGHQNAASIQNIGGDARIEGGIHASATWETLELRRTIAQTREEVAGLRLSPPVLETVSHSLDAAAAGGRRDEAGPLQGRRAPRRSCAHTEGGGSSRGCRHRRPPGVVPGDGASRPRRARHDRRRPLVRAGRRLALVADVLNGSCLCGGVRFEVTEPPVSASYCHCTRCQKRTGTAASPQARIVPGSLRITAGEDLVRAYEPPDGFPKAFCSGVRLGTLERQSAHERDRVGSHERLRRRSRRPALVPAVRRPTRPRGSRFRTTVFHGTRKAVPRSPANLGR